MSKHFISLSAEIPSKPPKREKRICFIRKLKDNQEKEKIKKFIDDYKKRQETDYFSPSKTISFGKIRNESKYDKENNLLPHSYVGFTDTFCSSTKKNKIAILSNSSRNFRVAMTPLVKKNKRNSILNNIDNFQYVDNKSLHSYFEGIKKRINNNKYKKIQKKNLIFRLPKGIKKSLNEQENYFRRIAKEEKINEKLENYIKKKTHKENKSELLMNKLNDYEVKMQGKTIINKNVTPDNKYKGNLWTVTLRNPAINGKYEKTGYLNVGTKNIPCFTLFNLNSNIEFVKNPKYKNKTVSFKYLDENSHLPKTKQDLIHLNNIKNLDVKGENLLKFEMDRENKIKGKKILYSQRNVEFLYSKEMGNSETKTIPNENYNFNDLTKNRIYANDYNIKDFYKGLNLTSKYSNSFFNTFN